MQKRLLFTSSVAAVLAFGLDSAAGAADLKMAGVMSGKDRNALELSGHINRQVMFFDDGEQSGARQTDNWYSESRITLKAKGKAGDLDVGTVLELGLGRYQTQAGISQSAQTPTPAGANFGRVRKSEFYLGTKSLGRLWLGRGSTAWDGTGGSNTNGSFVHWNSNAYLEAGGLFYRIKNQLPESEIADAMAAETADREAMVTETDMVVFDLDIDSKDADGGISDDSFSSTKGIGSLSSFLVRNTHSEIDGSRQSRIMYQTPSLGGFTAKISHASKGEGEDDGAYAAGLFYGGSLAGFTVKASAGYEKTDTEVNDAVVSQDNTVVSLGIGHKASGFGIAGAWGKSDYGDATDTRTVLVDGIRREDGSLGNLEFLDGTDVKALTADIVEVPNTPGGNVNLTGTGMDIMGTLDGSKSVKTNAFQTVQREDKELYYIAGSWTGKLSEMGKTIFVVSYNNTENNLSNGDEGKAYRVSIQQNVDAAALELFATFTHFSYEDKRIRGISVTGLGDDTDGTIHTADYDDLVIYTFGGRVKF